jgi:hypothetical protein
VSGWRQREARAQRDSAAQRADRLRKLTALDENLVSNGVMPLVTVAAAEALDDEQLGLALQETRAYVVQLARVLREATP